MLGVAALHGALLFLNSKNNPTIPQDERTPLKIKTVGTETSLKEYFYTEGNKSLDLKDLNIKPNHLKPLENLRAQDENIKNYLKKETPKGNAPKIAKTITPFTKEIPAPRESMSKYKTSDVGVNLELPKGVKLDELNEEELMFYSFQKRTAMKYISSFFSKLQEFERQNPHLEFPLTKSKTRMSGKIIYDKNGNIVRIKILEWTKPQRLQDFFVDVLKDLDSLPNPPKLLIDENDEFAIVYSLLINI